MCAKGLFVATGDDHWNLIVSLSARQLNPKLTIVSECVDLKNREKIIQAGANRVVSTSKISGLRMASEMVRPTVVSFLDKMLRDPQKGLRIEEVEVQNETLTKVGDLKLEAIQDILLLAVESRAGMRFNPPPESPLQGGDRLIVMATAEARNALATLLMCG